jgi:hypothetical protein
MATGDPDEEALAWAGDERLQAEPLIRPGRDASAPAAAEGETEPTPASLPAPLLITYGILAGLYLIYTVGWVITVTRSTTSLPNLLGEIMFQFGEFLAIASPGLWFVAVLLLTRGHRPLARLGWLALGLVLVIPWPLLLGV